VLPNKILIWIMKIGLDVAFPYQYLADAVEVDVGVWSRMNDMINFVCYM